MKNFALYGISCLMIISCFNCNDSDPKIEDCGLEAETNITASHIMDQAPFKPKYPCDYLAAKKNETDWKIFASSQYISAGDTLIIGGYNLNEALSFKFRFAGVGTYEIADVSDSKYFKDNAYYSDLVGGDVVLSYYSLNSSGLVEVTEYNEEEKLIKGYFQFPMQKHWGESIPETLLFKKGTFSVHLPEGN